MENIKKYFNCKVCERARLAKHRDAVRYVEMDGCCCFCCPACRQAVPMNQVYDINNDKKYSFYTCKCGTSLRFRRCKKPDTRTGLCYHPAQGMCQRCMCFACKCKGCGARALQKIPKIVIKLNNN